MTLQDLIDDLQALLPSSAKSANVVVCTKTTDAQIVGVDYVGGEVKIEVDDLPTPKSYDDGFEAGRKAGLEEGQETR